MAIMIKVPRAFHKAVMDVLSGKRVYPQPTPQHVTADADVMNAYRRWIESGDDWLSRWKREQADDEA